MKNECVVIERKCCRCAKLRIYGEKRNQGTVEGFLKAQGWKRVNTRWMCPTCVEEVGL